MEDFARIRGQPRTPDGCGIGVPKELLGNLLAEAELFC